MAFRSFKMISKRLVNKLKQIEVIYVPTEFYAKISVFLFVSLTITEEKLIFTSNQKG